MGKKLNIGNVFKNIGKDISEEEYRVHINGRTNKDAIEYIYGRKMKEVVVIGRRNSTAGK